MKVKIERVLWNHQAKQANMLTDLLWINYWEGSQLR